MAHPADRGAELFPSTPTWPRHLEQQSNVTSMELGLTRTERGLGFQWVTANIVGWAIGFFVCEALNAFLATVFVDGLVIGTAMGIAQWLVLRRPFAPMGWWVVVSIVGFGAGKAVGDAFVQGIPPVVGYGLDGAIIGASVGIGQWLVLRRHVARAGWWVIANIAAWALAWSIIGFAEASEGLPILMVYLVGATGAAVAGIITGIALIRLSRFRLA